MGYEKTYEDFSDEEVDFIQAINSLLESDSYSRPLVAAMVGLIEDAVESGSMLLHKHNLEFLHRFAVSPDIRVMVEHRNHPRKCPECGTKLPSLCGRLVCYKCTLTFFQEVPETNKQCRKCISFRDTQDPKYETMVQQGFGEGCPGTKTRGDEIALYEQLKKYGIIPEMWNKNIKTRKGVLEAVKKLKAEQQ